MAKSLVSAVTNILHKRVTEEEAKDFALNQYGVLASYIRNEFIENLKKQENEKSKKEKTKRNKPLNCKS